MAVAAFVMSGCTKGSPPTTVACPGGDPLRGIYSPDRLKVIDMCRWFSGTVLQVEQRSDGDQHLLLKPDTADAAMLAVGNVNAGGMVVEIVPGQQVPIPSAGDHIAVFGTFVLDQHNDWNEIHPVWAWKNLTTGQLYEGLPPASPEYNGDSND